MCRNIKTLFNFDPPVTDDEVRAASLQFVRKITGFNKPSKANEASFLSAVEEELRSRLAFCNRSRLRRRPEIAKRKRPKRKLALRNDSEPNSLNQAKSTPCGFGAANDSVNGGTPLGGLQCVRYRSTGKVLAGWEEVPRRAFS